MHKQKTRDSSRLTNEDYEHGPLPHVSYTKDQRRLMYTVQTLRKSTKLQVSKARDCILARIRHDLQILEQLPIGEDFIFMSTRTTSSSKTRPVLPMQMYSFNVQEEVAKQAFNLFEQWIETTYNKDDKHEEKEDDKLEEKEDDKLEEKEDDEEQDISGIQDQHQQQSDDEEDSTTDQPSTIRSVLKRKRKQSKATKANSSTNDRRAKKSTNPLTTNTIVEKNDTNISQPTSPVSTSSSCSQIKCQPSTTPQVPSSQPSITNRHPMYPHTMPSHTNVSSYTNPFYNNNNIAFAPMGAPHFYHGLYPYPPYFYHPPVHPPVQPPVHPPVHPQNDVPQHQS